MRATRLLPISVLTLACSQIVAQEPIIIDHRHADVTPIPPAWINAAKANLHIAYGHTSHGSQVTSGMTELVYFTGGVGGPQFAWNNGGSNGALDLHDYAMQGDVGYYPQWVNETQAYLSNPANSDVNVVMWAWCGQISGYSAQNLIDYYLQPMSQLEAQYPNVTFVYMTGHLDYSAMANTNARNQQVRDYCIANGKVLYDFADIESYDPDGNFYAYAADSCDYWNAGGALQGNWAQEWQNTHVQGVDWFQCSAAHSQPLNGNQKAFAAWQLFARLAGWHGRPLESDRPRLSAMAGGTVNLALDAGAGNGNRYYFLFGGTGTTPGTPLPGGLVTLPINADWFTGVVINGWNTPYFANFRGWLDGSGQASAQLAVPPSLSILAGQEFHFAYALVGPSIDFASNPVPLLFEP